MEARWCPNCNLGQKNIQLSSDLKHVAEVCCTGWDFPLVGVLTNLSISGYLHKLLVCSRFICTFHRKAMGIFPLQKMSKKIQ